VNEKKFPVAGHSLVLGMTFSRINKQIKLKEITAK
jgi:hypothetical protein